MRSKLFFDLAIWILSHYLLYSDVLETTGGFITGENVETFDLSPEAEAERELSPSQRLDACFQRLCL